MQYVIAFLEGIITFVSPCLLPMLPIYISYFAGTDIDKQKNNALKNSLSFVCGFTLIFVAMGAFAGSIGVFLNKYQSIINIVTGLVVIFFGLHYLGAIKINLFKGSKKTKNMKNLGMGSSFLFGIVFSIGWTPCVGAFLGSALALASQQGSIGKGILMLLAYSLGLGIPFVISAVLIDQLKGTFDFIKRNYKVITTVSGIMLIIVGIMMMTGLMGYLLSFLSFGL